MNSGKPNNELTHILSPQIFNKKFKTCMQNENISN